MLSYTIAGVGSRVLAALVDYFICFIAMIVLVASVATLLPIGSGPSGSSSEAVALALVILGQFFVLWGYYVIFEGLADGQTPGKKLMRLRVVRDGGYSVTFAASAARNLVRIVDMQPLFFYGVGIASIVISKSGKRLGDIVAGTIVVREALVQQPAAGAPVASAPAANAAPALHTALTEEEFAVLERFVQRRGALEPERRAVLARQLAGRFAPAIREQAMTMAETAGTSDQSRLVRLYDAERAARAHGLSARSQTGAARERHVIIATRSPRWIAFAAILANAQRAGLRSLGEAGVREFVAEYRDLAADLARLRTAARGIDAEEIFYLSRLLSGAHNLLYRGAPLTLTQVLRYLTLEAPREVRRSWRPIALAAALLFGPAVIAYTAVVQQPEVAKIFIPPAMLDRAENGVRRAREGTGYIPDPQIFRPVMASQIIANNIQVTFGAFAFGITGGLGTLVLLVLNGVSLGGVLGLYTSKHIARLLLAFVAPHGVLELSAVCVGGGAGFLLAAALLVPGRRSRKQALVENGGRALRLVTAACVLLLVAGTLEGFVSPIPWWPLGWKLAIAGATALLLAGYLSAGSRREPTSARERKTEESLLSLGGVGDVDPLAPRALRAT